MHVVIRGIIKHRFTGKRQIDPKTFHSVQFLWENQFYLDKTTKTCGYNNGGGAERILNKNNLRIFLNVLDFSNRIENLSFNNSNIVEHNPNSEFQTVLF